MIRIGWGNRQNNEQCVATHLSKFRGLFKDGDVVASPSERDGGSQTSQARTDDNDVESYPGPVLTVDQRGGSHCLLPLLFFLLKLYEKIQAPRRV